MHRHVGIMQASMGVFLRLGVRVLLYSFQCGPCMNMNCLCECSCWGCWGRSRFCVFVCVYSCRGGRGWGRSLAEMCTKDEEEGARLLSFQLNRGEFAKHAQYYRDHNSLKHFPHHYVRRALSFSCERLLQSAHLSLCIRPCPLHNLELFCQLRCR